MASPASSGPQTSRQGGLLPLAMIALAGVERLALGQTDGLDAAARPRWPLDQDAAAQDPASGSGRKGPKA